MVLQINVVPTVNNPPVMADPPDIEVFIDTGASFDIGQHGSDPDDDSTRVDLNEAVIPLPGGFSYVSATGILTWSGSGSAVVSAGHTGRAFDGFLTSEPSNPFNITISPAPIPPVVGAHPMAQNINGGFISNNVDRFWDDTDPLHLWVRLVGGFVAFQPRQLWSSQRPARALQLQEIHEANPFLLLAVHDSPHRFEPYRLNNNAQRQWRLDYANANRQTALVFRLFNGSNSDEVPFIEAKNGAGTGQQPWVHMRLDEIGLQTEWAGIICDVLTGADKMGRGMSGIDISDGVTYFNDGCPPVNPKFNRDVLDLIAKGTLNAVPSSGQLGIDQNIVTLNSQPGLATSGTLAADASFGAVTDPAPIGFVPANQSSPGWSGFYAIGYDEISGGRSRIYVKNLPSDRSGAQHYQPAVNDLWNICDPDNGTNSPDQDSDGDTDDGREEGSNIWTNGRLARDDILDTLMQAEVGHATGRGWNAGGGIQMKQGGGLPHPHAGFRKADYMNAENGEDIGRYEPDNAAASQEYDVSNSDMSSLMRGFYHMESYIRDNPGGWNEDKARGVLYDISVFDKGQNYDNTNNPAGRMASYLRFYKAIMLTVPNTGMGTTITVGWPVWIPEMFFDFDLGWTQPAPLGVYDPTAGGDGSAGTNRPVGGWTWASGGVGDFTDNGRLLFGRRVGLRHFIFLNMLNAPAGRTVVRHSHLAGGDTPRDPLDTLTPADFTSLVTGGALGAGETLQYPDAGEYINASMTAALRAHPESAAAWASHSYGPEEASPFDATYNTLNTPIMARDAAMLNRGDLTFDTSVKQGIGTQEALILEVV